MVIGVTDGRQDMSKQVKERGLNRRLRRRSEQL